MTKQGNPKTNFEWEIVKQVLDKRNALKISQAKIADFLGVSRGYIGQIEMRSSGSMYTYDQLNKLAGFLKSSPKDFMPVLPIEYDEEILYEKLSKAEINVFPEELTDIQTAAWALLFNVSESTVSKWDANMEKPNLETLREMDEVLKADNEDLLFPKKGKKTGFTDALQVEYKRLLKKGLAKKIDVKDKKGNIKKVNNPEFVRALREFVEEYKGKRK
ncbi:MAG TPA: helix-turn-helix transcriptional regulator [Sphingobacterium sp.]|nr:helix-turn-helix transcriptional regulator [Sphingobacterium sp.]